MRTQRRTGGWNGCCARWLCAAAGAGWLLTAPLAAADKPSASKTAWQVLYSPRRTAGVAPLPEQGPLKSLTALELKGAPKTDPFHLGHFNINGEFAVAQGFVQRASGKNAAVQIAQDVGDFELEAGLQAEGLGGWFLLLGWRDAHGYAVYHTATKKSGCPWCVAELRGGTILEDTLQEFNRYEWKGVQPLRLAVAESKLQLQLGNARLARDLELPNYHAGDIVLGTYDTPYGPRDVRIQSVKLRRPATTK